MLMAWFWTRGESGSAIASRCQHHSYCRTVRSILSRRPPGSSRMDDEKETDDDESEKLPSSMVITASTKEKHYG